jgi:hypothetical protein
MKIRLATLLTVFLAVFSGHAIAQLDSAKGLGASESIGPKPPLRDRRPDRTASGRTDGIKVDTNVQTIRATPAAFIGKRNLRVNLRPTAIRKHESGWIGRQSGITTYLTRQAKEYYDRAKQNGSPAVFRTDVIRDDSGRPALVLRAGAYRP